MTCFLVLTVSFTEDNDEYGNYASYKGMNGVLAQFHEYIAPKCK